MRKMGITIKLPFLEVTFPDVWSTSSAVRDDKTRNKQTDTQALYFFIVNRMSGKCLEVANGGLSDGDRVQQMEYRGGANQLWLLQREENNLFRLVNKHSQKCLDVVGGLLSPGVALQQWQQQSHWNGGQNQLWSLTEVEGDAYMISAKHSGLFLDISGANSANETPIIQWSKHEGRNLHWWFKLAVL